ncbi:hypothetical protein F5B18DRAFT_626105 [Nemania serpens]|nr:hypothetical protein F5B18DRAFT_626105 [Nemania serpens]
MVAGGWNSPVISAACHVPDTENHLHEQPHDNELGSCLSECIFSFFEYRQLTANSKRHYIGAQTEYTEVALATEEDGVYLHGRLGLSRRKLRWGATELPGRLTDLISAEDQAVLHLGFGGEEHIISEPKDDQYYFDSR